MYHQAQFETNVDIVVVGSGLAATACVCALQGLGLRMLLLEHHRPVYHTQPAMVDTRPLTLALGSARYLNQLGYWSPMLAKLAEPVQGVHVSVQGQLGQLLFTATEYHVPALGYVVPFDQLQAVLYDAAVAMPHVTVLPYAKIIALAETDQHIVLQAQLTASHERKIDSTTPESSTRSNTAINDSTTASPDAAGVTETFGQVTARLAILADGTQSPCRTLLGIETKQTARGDQARVMALTVNSSMRATSRLPLRTAFERMTPHGILALLPLSDANHYRVVLTQTVTQRQHCAAWDDVTWLTWLERNLGYYIGSVKQVTLLAEYPLTTCVAQQQLTTRSVLLGNAAHTIYPLAAQGFNLTLRDVTTLAMLLRDDVAAGRQLLSADSRARYLAWRRSDQVCTAQFTSLLHDGFSVVWPGIATMGGLSLFGIGCALTLKRRIARQLMGLATVPAELSS